MSYEVGSGGPVTDEEWEAHNARHLAKYELAADNAELVRRKVGLSAAVPEAKSKQVGGDHYSKLAHQPWDILQERLGLEGFKAYLLGTVVAYLIREKNGLEDLQKARHTLDRLIELETDGRR